ncbi:SRPBCC family protein [Synechococcus sp. PCC 6312]|uniref:SRPBCC family protein n=1 Tax=Synechococcus sp. (strain ATCC 27167 / PCC 6312) TaxID=195253 RepID=UPI00029EF1A3|nr:SRPBCC family protein [Synechococcus sp. PCC 6312]AFY60745.1 Polyketide cyclase / dehydrase and lipid transport [Synechococcus sp. PCC 6312]
MKFTHTQTTVAPPERIWHYWIDITTWPAWDTELIKVEITGEFKLGTQGSLISKVGPTSVFVITKFQPPKSYELTVRLPLCWLWIFRYVQTNSNLTTFTHQIEFSELLSGVFGLIIGRNFKKVLPTVMKQLRDLAEEKPSAF